MSKFEHILPTKSEALLLAFVLSLLVLPLLSRISNVPVVHEMWEVLDKCKIGDCNNISSVASIVGTFFVVATLIVTILSLFSSSAKYRNQMREMNSKHQEQMNLMNNQIRLLVQSNRMRTLREYMIALSTNVCVQIDEDYDGCGLCIEEDGVIFGWSFLPKEKLLEYRLCVVMRLFSPELENRDEILRSDTWWRISINVNRLADGSHIVTGFVNNNGSYMPIEKELCDLTEDEYNSVMIVVLSLTIAEKDRLMSYQEKRNWMLNQQKQG